MHPHLPRGGCRIPVPCVPHQPGREGLQSMRVPPLRAPAALPVLLLHANPGPVFTLGMAEEEGEDRLTLHTDPSIIR